MEYDDVLVPPYETPLLCPPVAPAVPALRSPPLLSPAASSPAAVLLGSLEEGG